MGIKPGPTDFEDIPRGSTAAFHCSVFGIEFTVEDFDLVDDLVLEDTFEPDLVVEEDVLDWTDLIDRALPLVEPPSSVGLQ